MADYAGVVFQTNGGTLNLGVELVDQPTIKEPWGMLTNFGEAGDFNLFAGQGD